MKSVFAVARAVIYLLYAVTAGFYAFTDYLPTALGFTATTSLNSSGYGLPTIAYFFLALYCLGWVLDSVCWVCGGYDQPAQPVPTKQDEELPSTADDVEVSVSVNNFHTHEMLSKPDPIVAVYRVTQASFSSEQKENNAPDNTKARDITGAGCLDRLVQGWELCGTTEVVKNVHNAAFVNRILVRGCSPDSIFRFLVFSSDEGRTDQEKELQAYAQIPFARFEEKEASINLAAGPTKRKRKLLASKKTKLTVSCLPVAPDPSYVAVPTSAGEGQAKGGGGCVVQRLSQWLLVLSAGFLPLIPVFYFIAFQVPELNTFATRAVPFVTCVIFAAACVIERYRSKWTQPSGSFALMLCEALFAVGVVLFCLFMSPYGETDATVRTVVLPYSIFLACQRMLFLVVAMVVAPFALNASLWVHLPRVLAIYGVLLFETSLRDSSIRYPV